MFLMVGVNRGTRNPHYYPPKLVVRTQPDPSAHIPAASSAKRYGGIDTQLFPVSVNFKPGPVGADAVIRAPYAYAYASDKTKMIDDLRAKIITLEWHSRMSRRAVRRVIFRGRVKSIGKQLSDTENGVDIYLGGGWEWLSDWPVRIPQAGASNARHLGEAFALLSTSLYRSYGSTDTGEAVTSSETLTQLSPRLWPRDSSGNKIGDVDPALFSWFSPVTDVPWRGQPLSQLLVDLINQRRGYIPDIYYDGDNFYVTGREIGHNPFDLVIGTFGKSGTNTRIPDVLEMRGTENYNGIINRVIGKGKPVETAKTVTLSKAWTAAEETALLADPALQNARSHWHVGRLWRIPETIYPINPGTYDEKGAAADQNARLLDTMKIWVQSPENSTWKEYQGDWKLTSSSHKRVSSRSEMNLHTYLDYASGGDVYIVFPNPLVVEYYTAAQKADREAGTAVPRGTLSIVNVSIQCMSLGPELSYDTGHVGTFPRERIRFIETSASRINVESSSYYETDSNGDRVVISSPIEAEDDTWGMRVAAISKANERSQPSSNYQATFWRLDPNLCLGQGVDRIVDGKGRVVEEDLGWYISEIDHNFFEARTRVSFSPIEQSIKAGFAFN